MHENINNENRFSFFLAFWMNLFKELFYLKKDKIIRFNILNKSNVINE